MFAPTETATRPRAGQPIDFVASKFPRRVLQLQSKVLGFFPDFEFVKVLHALPPCLPSLLTPHDRFDFASSPGPAAKNYSQNSHPATATPRPRAPTRTELRKFGRGQLRLEAVHNLVDVRGFIRFEQGENPSLARAEWVV